MDGTAEIREVKHQSEYEDIFELKEKTGKICFKSLDNLPKVISFDFIETKDPLKGAFSETQKQETHEKMF